MLPRRMETLVLWHGVATTVMVEKRCHKKNAAADFGTDTYRLRSCRCTCSSMAGSSLEGSPPCFSIPI